MGYSIGAGHHGPRPSRGSDGTGDCFTPHDSPFCGRDEYCERVYTLVPECCTNSWNQLCAEPAHWPVPLILIQLV